jgi:hypothetical protein
MAPNEYRFYYRLPQELVYIPVESVVAYLGKKRYGASELVERVELELPLQRHTDVFAPFLEERSVWKALSFVLADVLQSGQASIWHTQRGFVREIEVESYTEQCEAGRRFRYSGGGVFFGVIDAVA